jgi:isopentenyl phosphate kinase
LSGPVLLKLGGALLTDKAGVEALHGDRLERLAAEVAQAGAAGAGDLVLAHGSGSFAHVAVRRSGYHRDPADLAAAAEVSAAARRLNVHVVEALLRAGLAAVAVPGSLLARCRGGRIEALRVDLVATWLAAGALPVTYGDVAVDATQGTAIAGTEDLVSGLAIALAARRVVLASDVDGVFEADPHAHPQAQAIPLLGPRRAAALGTALGAARAGTVDVTGGMAQKVASMLALAGELPGIEIRLVSGLRPGAVAAALAGDPAAGGTLIRATD